MYKPLHIMFVFIKKPVLAVLLLFAAAMTVAAQSTNIDFPSPVIASDVSGEIAARDIGDARLTRHFYLLTGTPGDLIVTVESDNLNGDVDLFTAGSLRPLAKLSMYAGRGTSGVSRTVFLRKREQLILRVEARSATDDAGRYRVKFSGGFEPVAGVATESAEQTVSTTTRRDKNTRRVSSSGARIEEPEPVVEAQPSEPEPIINNTKETGPPTETPVVTPTPAKTKPARTPRTNRTKTPRVTTPKKTPTTTAKKRPAPAASTATAPPATPAAVALGPRLIIETTDGMRVERYMSEVRRMTVEKGQLIVVTISGKIERRAMSEVQRVTIEP